MSRHRWWDPLVVRARARLRTLPDRVEPPQAQEPEIASHVDLWDLDTEVTDLVRSTLVSAGLRVRERDPQSHPVAEAGAHVVLVPLAVDTGDDRTHLPSEALARRMHALTRARVTRRTRVTFVWVVPRDVRHLMWTPHDSEGRHHNAVLLTLASAWSRTLRRAGSVQVAVTSISGQTRRAVDDLHRTTLLLPPRTGQLLRYVDALDPGSRHVLLCQALDTGTDGWHGREAVHAAVLTAVAEVEEPIDEPTDEPTDGITGGVAR